VFAGCGPALVLRTLTSSSPLHAAESDPVSFIFRIAFTLDRLGQHDDIDPTDPAKWGTLMRGHWFWDVVYLNSNYHLEHQYFPGVPFYRLPEVQRALRPFYARKQMKWRTYGELVYGWLVENQAPHTNRDGERVPAGPPSPILPTGSRG
jgi:fatty acid desaturase